MEETIKHLAENSLIKLIVKSSSLGIISRKNSYKTDDKWIKIFGVSVEKSISLHSKILEITSVFTPEEARGKGEATELFLELTRLLDSLNLPAWLEVHPYSSNGLNTKQLISFYSKFGFVLEDPNRSTRPYIMIRGAIHERRTIAYSFIRNLQTTTGRGLKKRKEILCCLI